MTLPLWLQVVGIVVTAAAAVAAVTPNKADNIFMDKVYKFINTLGLNVFQAKNKDD